MKRRHQRRTRTALMAGAGVLIGLLSTTVAGPADAAPTTGRVSAGGTHLNVRTGPTTKSALTSTLKHGSRVKLVCQQRGELIRGNVRTTNVWDRLRDGSYVSDGFIKRAGTLPSCTDPASGLTPKASLYGFVRPVPTTVGSGFRTKDRPSHDGVDLSAARNTPIRSVAAGTVVLVACNTSTKTCDVDGSVKATGCGWYVEVRHAGNVVTRYCHMVRRPSVRLGQTVGTGHVIGYVGTSGNSSGPHLHFEVHLTTAYADHGNAVDPVKFMRSKGVSLG